MTQSLLHVKVCIEVCQHTVNLPWLQVGRQGTITSVRRDIIYVTLDALTAPPQVTTVLTAAATLLGIYTGLKPVPTATPIQHTKVNLNIKQQSSFQGICEKRMWRVHEIAPSVTSTHLVVPCPAGGCASSSRWELE